MGNRCATAVGVLDYNPPQPMYPVGSPCVWSEPSGRYWNGRVVQ
jgi:hypothetical protein